MASMIGSEPRPFSNGFGPPAVDALTCRFGVFRDLDSRRESRHVKKQFAKSVPVVNTGANQETR